MVQCERFHHIKGEQHHVAVHDHGPIARPRWWWYDHRLYNLWYDVQGSWSLSCAFLFADKKKKINHRECAHKGRIDSCSWFRRLALYFYQIVSKNFRAKVKLSENVINRGARRLIFPELVTANALDFNGIYRDTSWALALGGLERIARSPLYVVR